MTIPHYEQAPITDKNLQAIMDSLYPDYKEGFIGYYLDIARKLIILSNKLPEHQRYNMDSIEKLCYEMRSIMPMITQPGLNSVFHRAMLLDAILLNRIHGFTSNVTVDAFRQMVRRMNEMKPASIQ